MENKEIELNDKRLNAVNGGQSRETYVVDGVIYTRLFEDCHGMKVATCSVCAHEKECPVSCLAPLPNVIGDTTEKNYDQSKKC